MLLLLMLAQAATAAPPPAGQEVSSPIVTNAYPKVAAEHRWEGTARADLTISADGAVTSCKIIQSTSHQLLDDYVCSSLLRAKFTPAKDENGKAIEAHYVTPPIVFKIRH
jgi:protein TonB